jgi:transcription initiation factor TFIIF subunit alpha
MRGPQSTRVKVEKYEDDFKREGRQQERVSLSTRFILGKHKSLILKGMEGGIDEELDYDVTEEFQDDDENNTFYHDQEEEEDTKLQEVRLGRIWREDAADWLGTNQEGAKASQCDLWRSVSDCQPGRRGRRRFVW